MDISTTNNLSVLGSLPLQKPLNRQNAQDEFAVIFYREMLKQTFAQSTDNLGVAQDVFIERMARELAVKNRQMLPPIK